MHEILEALEEINLSSQEYCTLAVDTYHNTDKFSVYVPKLMPGIPFESRKTWNEGVNNVFANDPGCAIAFSKTVALQNYLTVPRFLDSNFHYRADRNGYLYRGTRFMMQVMYGNPKDIFLERVL